MEVATRMVQLVLLLPQNGRRVFIVGEPCAYYSLRLQPQWKRRRCGLGAVHPLEAHMGAVSHSRGPAGSRTRLTRARATAGSGGRVWGATLSAGQPRGPRTLTYECRARDADTGAGRPALPLMVLPSAVRSPPLRSPDGLLQPVDRRSVRWTPSVGRVSGT